MKSVLLRAAAMMIAAISVCMAETGEGGPQGRDLPQVSYEVETIVAPAQGEGSPEAETLCKLIQPSGLMSDGKNLYVVDTHTIRMIVLATGTVATLAGTADAWGSADGTGAAARFTNPSGVTTDGTNLYVTDSGNHTVRKIVIETGAVTILAGGAGDPGSADGRGIEARFNEPDSIVTDGANLYVTDNPEDCTGNRRSHDPGGERRRSGVL